MPVDPKTGQPLPYSSRGIIDPSILAALSGAQQPTYQISPTAENLMRQGGLFGFPGALLGAPGNILGREGPPVAQQVFEGLGEFLLGQQQLQPQGIPSALATQFSPSKQLEGQELAGALGMEQAPSGRGSSRTFQGSPLPNAPQLQAPNIDTAALFNPILGELQDPKKIEGASKIGGLAQILGGAAAGAQRGLEGSGEVGSVLAGAGAGASAGAEGLRQERERLELIYQDQLQRVQSARAGVLSQKAGADIGVAENEAEIANLSAQLQFARDREAAAMSRPQTQPLGNGYVMTTRYDPETGQIVQEMEDTVDPYLRTMERWALMSKVIGKPKDPGVILDTKEYKFSALATSMLGTGATNRQKLVLDVALRVLSDPRARDAYAQAYEEFLKGESSEAARREWEEAPDHVLLDLINSDLTENQDKLESYLQELGGLPYAGQSGNSLPDNFSGSR